MHIEYIDPSGTSQRVEGERGLSLMQIAKNNLVPGILGDCGGLCSCATCHVHVDAAWSDRLPPRSADEETLLEGVPGTDDRSRLSCQIEMREEYDGIVVHVPVEQY